MAYPDNYTSRGAPDSAQDERETEEAMKERIEGWCVWAVAEMFRRGRLDNDHWDVDDVMDAMAVAFDGNALTDGYELYQKKRAEAKAALAAG